MKWSLILACIFLPHSCILGAAHTECKFSERLYGRWFQSGVTQPVFINGSDISSKGQCIDTVDNKYLMQDPTYKCYRCIVLHEKHLNVLQYKETLCLQRSTKPSLTSVCSEFRGDAVLYSLFRTGMAPSSCPMKGPLEFTYSQGDHTCDTPKSQAEACTQDSRLLLRYQACVNVHSSESIDEVLECLATWKEGSVQYLVGRLHGNWKTNDENIYRCFIYQKTSNSTWNLAQSADAACTGLTSVTEGAKALQLRQKSIPQRCSYPPWLVAAKTWVALDQMALRLLTSTHNLTILDSNDTRLACHSYVDGHHHHRTSSGFSDSQVKVVAKATRDCMNGYVCLIFHKRDDHVIEMQQSQWSEQPEDVCSPGRFNPRTTPYTTFITSDPVTRKCPYFGRYEVVSIVHPHSAEYASGVRCHRERVRLLDIGCRMPDRMEVATSCTDETLPEYLCHGTWVENGTAYLVASTDAGRYCFVYSVSATTAGSHELSVTGHLDSCPRSSHRRPGAWQVNLTSHAQCGDVSSGGSWRFDGGRWAILQLLVFCILLAGYVAR